MKAQQIVRTETLAGAGAPGAVIPSGIIERRGVQAIARGTGILGRSQAEFGQQIQTSVRRDMVSHNYALAQRDIADAELNLKADPDHRSVPEKFSRDLDDIRAKYSDRILDPVASNMFQRKMFEYGNTREIQMKYFTHNREVDAQKAHLTEILDTKLDLIDNLDLGDRKTYSLYLEEAMDAINEKTANGVITAVVGANAKLEFKGKAANLKARQHVIIDPESAAQTLGRKDYEKFYPGLDNEKRLNLFEKAQATIIRNQNAETSFQEKIEQLAVKVEKERQAANYGKAVVLYSNNELTSGFLEEAVENRDLDPEKGFKLINRLRTDAKQGKIQENNPIVVGDLAVRIGRGEDVSLELIDGLANGDIKDETYITLSTNMGKLEVQRAYSYINKAMQPSEFETDFNLKQTWADAIDLLNERIARDEDPMTAARDIVRLRRKRLPTPPAGRPRYLDGDVKSISDLEKAMSLTVKNFKADKIGSIEANQETDLIERHIEWLKMQAETDETLKDMDKETK